MRHMFIIAVTTTAFLILIPMLGWAQYVYYYPSSGSNVYQRYHPAPHPSARSQPHGNPFNYFLRPPPEVARKWKQYQKWLNAQRLRRSPFNPESTVEYMLRTFF